MVRLYDLEAQITMRIFRRRLFVLALLLALSAAACAGGPEEPTPGEDSYPLTISPTAPAPTPSPSPTPSPVLTPSPPVETADLWALWVDGPHLRGANVWQRLVVPELDGDEFLGAGPLGPPYTQADFRRLAAAGANYVNLSHPGLFTERPPFVLDEAVQSNLDHLLDMAARAGLFAVITFRTGPGRSDFTFYRDGAGDWFDEDLLIESLWTDQEAQDAWAQMWRYTAARYHGHPALAGYDLLCEPNPESVALEIWDPEEFYPAYADTIYDWNRFYPRLVAAIREVDPDTPILVSPMGWGAVRWLPYLQPTADSRTVYAVHQYEPQAQYTHQEAPAVNAYPGRFDLDWDGEPEAFDRDWLEDYLGPIDNFRARYKVPMAVNEFGVQRWVPGAAQFMQDQIALFEAREMNHALWVWNPAWEPWSSQVNNFDLLCGPDPTCCDESTPNELLQVVQSDWARSQVRPAGPEPSAAARPDLAGVRHWLYLIDVELDEEMVDRLATSEYDLIVLDWIPSEREHAGYPMADVVARLHAGPHPRLVVAYVDIGQAEDYRTYWQEGWQVGDPDWIAGGDPDGWEGNYPVAYWREAWRDIWLAEDGLLNDVIDAGLDGIYLDWIEAYADENVIEVAARDGVDPVDEMVRWVGDLGAFGRARRPGFLVIAQNAAELLEREDYPALIDAIAQEQIWFDGGADNEPPGDCPLPRTEAEVDTPAYRRTLSAACRRAYDRDPDGTLHTSSQEYLSYLALARQKGLLVLTVDYALEPENVAWVYRTSRDLGFVPFCSSRGLDRYIDPVP